MKSVFVCLIFLCIHKCMSLHLKVEWISKITNIMLRCRVKFLNWHILIVKPNNCHCVAGSSNQRSPSIDSVLDIVHHAKNFPHIFATSRYSAEQSSTLEHKNDSNPFYQGNKMFQPFDETPKLINFMVHLYSNQ